MSIFDVRIPGLKLTVVAADGQDVEPVSGRRIPHRHCGDLRRHRRAEGRSCLHDFRAVDRSLRLRARNAGAAVRDDGGSSAARSAAAADHERHGTWRGSRRDDGSRSPGDAAGRCRRWITRPWGMARCSAHAAPSCARPRTDRPSTCASSRPATGLDDPGVGLRDNGRRVLTLRGSAHDRRAHRPPRARARDRAASHRPHGALHLVVQRPEVLGSRTAAFQARRAPAHHAGERHDDDASDPPARDVERGRGRARRSSRCASTRSWCSPAQRISYAVTADALGRWAYHCHLLYHMEAGMFREVEVASAQAHHGDHE